MVNEESFSSGRTCWLKASAQRSAISAQWEYSRSILTVVYTVLPGADLINKYGQLYAGPGLGEVERDVRSEHQGLGHESENSDIMIYTNKR